MGDSGEIFVFGASGHAKVVMDIVERAGVSRVALLADDDDALWGETVYGYPVIGGREALREAASASGVRAGIIGIGSNSARLRVAAWLAEAGFVLAVAVHPSAQLARGVGVGEGTVVMAGATLNSDVVLGRNVVVNTGATVDHDCVIGDGAHIAPGATLCGNVRIGEGALVGAGATVIPNIRIGCGAVVGAGATVVRDIPDGMVVVGTPARPLRVG